jgi:hypothetical protein
MIVSAHVASGGAGGLLVGSRLAAVVLGAGLHALGDAIPHQDIPSRRFEVCSGVVGLAALAWTRGPLHPATLGAAACAAPDLEHVLPLPRPGGRKLFPTHRVERWHRSGGIPAWAQLAAAGLAIAAIARR